MLDECWSFPTLKWFDEPFCFIVPIAKSTEPDGVAAYDFKLGWGGVVGEEGGKGVESGGSEGDLQKF